MIRCEQCGAMNDRSQSVCEFCESPLDGGEPTRLSERQETETGSTLPLVIVLVIIGFFLIAVLMGLIL